MKNPEEPTQLITMNNYFGIGVDADVCLEFAKKVVAARYSHSSTALFLIQLHISIMACFREKQIRRAFVTSSRTKYDMVLLERPRCSTSVGVTLIVKLNYVLITWTRRLNFHRLKA